MTHKEHWSEKAFLVVAVMATLFVLLEMLLQSYGKSICGTAGCQLVAKQTRFGDLSILLVGLGTFSLLSWLSWAALFRGRQDLEKYIDAVLIVSLACEGFFTGYQAFRLHAACLFCLIVFALLVALGALRLLAGRKEVLVGFASLAAVFVLFYLVLPVDSSVSIPPGRKMVLFYSAGCKHCTAVRSEIERNNFPVDEVPVEPYIGMLKSMGVKGVPTLFVNNDAEKIFIYGQQGVLDYLSSVTKGNTGKADRSNRSTDRAVSDRSGFRVTPPQAGNGACKPDENCN